MKLQYIVRLDDAHPRQHSRKWEKIESLLDSYDIKPIVAIIPDNKDNSINHDEIEIPDFWTKVKKWKAKGWKIAVHGLHHQLRIGYSSILVVSKKSEFSGKSLQEQVNILKKGIDILQKKECSPEYFIAPAHGYDHQTLVALKIVSPELVISDGFGFRPFVFNGVKYLPQQLWRGRRMPFGTWTICLHPSNMTELDFNEFNEFLRNNLEYFNFSYETIKYHNKNYTDKLFEFLLSCIYYIK